MTGAKYRSLLWELIAASDTARHDFPTVDDVQLHARAGAISILLGNMFGATADFSFLSQNDWTDLNYEVAAMMNTDDAPWMFVARKNGIALLMALALQGIEQHL